MQKYILFFLIALGAFFSFTNLNWDNGFFLNWDERQIGESVQQIKWFSNLNPHFFKYGSLPIYIISLTGNFLNLFSEKDWTSWQNAVYIGRFLSAFLSVLLIPLTYLITKELIQQKQNLSKNNKILNFSFLIFNYQYAPLLSAFFVTTSIGLIQHAHFATYQIVLTFESLIIFYLSLKILNLGQLEWAKNTKFSPKYSETATKTTLKDSDTTPANVFQKIFCIRAHLLLVFIGIITGLSLATKINNFSILPIPIIAILLCKTPIKQKLINLFLFFIFTLMFLFITAPYNFLDYPSFSATIKDEMEIASGRQIFYNDQFIGSTPIIFQFTKIFPFIINPILTILFILSFFWLVIKTLSKRNSFYLLLVTCILSLFIPALFFSKWTRHLIPLLPFVYITISLFITNMIQKIRSKVLLVTCVYPVGALLLVTFCLSYSFAFLNIYLTPHPAFKTLSWMSQNLPKNAKILTEDLDVTIDPIKKEFPDITLFDFYSLDNKVPPKTTTEELAQKLKENEYFLILSRKVFQNRLKNPDLFPNSASFYDNLFQNRSEFVKIYESENPFQIFGIKIDDNNSEESFQVYDHPQLLLFKKR